MENESEIAFYRIFINGFYTFILVREITFDSDVDFFYISVASCLRGLCAFWCVLYEPTIIHSEGLTQNTADRRNAGCDQKSIF